MNTKDPTLTRQLLGLCPSSRIYSNSIFLYPDHSKTVTILQDAVSCSLDASAILLTFKQMSETQDTPEAIPPQNANEQKPQPNKPAQPKPVENKVAKLLEKNPLGMTLPEMAGGPRQLKRIRTLRPILAEAIKQGLVMPVSQRAGHTVYKLVKFMGPR